MDRRRDIENREITARIKGELVRSFDGELESSEYLAEDEPEKYQSHFSEHIKRGVEVDDVEEMYKKVHVSIRADPTAKKSEKEPPKKHKQLYLNMYGVKPVAYD